MQIATLTMNPTIDISTSTGQLVAERKLRCERPRYDPGGGGINVSRAIRKLDGESLAVFPAGGTTGQMLRELLERQQLRHVAVPTSGRTRENFTVYEESSGQQYRFVLPGPPLSEQEWRRCLYELSYLDPQPEYLVASGSLPPGAPDDFYRLTVRLAKEHRIRIIVDSSGIALRHAVEEGVFLVKPNLNELRDLTGDELRDESQQEEAAHDLVDSGKAEHVVVSLGAAGVLYVGRDQRRRIRAPTVRIQSKVGAGDSTVAGVVLALARGMEMLEAVRFGVAAGSAAVMTAGTELCDKDDTERLYRRIAEKDGA
ncbi:MAG: 1-phosphofructokinase family hexose kinase [Phycisphaerae bacterium]|nr:1-phosphofructokinase family hexose kinase [Phycisphaerae bacterium]